MKIVLGSFGMRGSFFFSFLFEDLRLGLHGWMLGGGGIAIVIVIVLCLD